MKTTGAQSRGPVRFASPTRLAVPGTKAATRPTTVHAGDKPFGTPLGLTKSAVMLELRTEQSTIRDLCTCATPTQLLKFGRGGKLSKPGYRVFALSPSLDALEWHSKHGERKDLPSSALGTRAILISDMIELSLGQTTEKFKRNNKPELAHRCFSILYNDGPVKDTLDLCCKDEKEFQTWTNVLSLLLENKLPPESLARYKMKVKEYIAERSLQQHEPEDVVCDIWAFGWNQWGQLGTNPNDISTADPANVTAGGPGVTMVACGWAHTSAINEEGHLTQLGNMVGTHLPYDVFKPVVTALKVELVAVACGAHHSAALTVDGHLLTWGANLYGQLGHGHTNDVREPTVVEELLITTMELELFVVQVACGANCTAALGEDGTVYTWGSNAHGCLGHNDALDRSLPEAVRDLAGAAITKIAVGDCHMVACTDSDTYAWGWNAMGQLGMDHEEDGRRPHLVDALRGRDVLSISCGAAHTLACVTLSGTGSGAKSGVYNRPSGMLFAWGSNQQGQLGLHKVKKVLSPTLVNGVPPVAQVACGAMHSCLLTPTGKVFSTGYNKYGQLGHGHVEEVNTFTEIATKASAVHMVVCGGMHTIFECPRNGLVDAAINECMDCGARFTLALRKHRCRKCGNVYCGSCTAKKFVVPSTGSFKPERVCNKCYKQLAGR